MPRFGRSQPGPMILSSSPPQPLQRLRPASGGSSGFWSRGGTDSGSLGGQLDETAGPDDADWIQSDANPQTSKCRIPLGSAPSGDPGGASSGSDYVVHWRPSSLSGTQGTLTIGFSLYEGGSATIGSGTLRAGPFSRVVGIGAAPSNYTEVLSAAEADAISDFTVLWVEFVATQS